MRAVVQRVSRAQVDIGGQTVGAIGRGLVVLLGVGHDDTEAEAERLWSKIARLRIFEDADGKTNLALADVDGEVLVVSQFTLYARCKKGNRPSFTDAGAPDEANRLYEWFVERARRDVPRVETGRFGAYMDVSLVNDGPFTSGSTPHRCRNPGAAYVQHAYASACSHSASLKPTSTKSSPTTIGRFTSMPFSASSANASSSAMPASSSAFTLRSR